MRRGETGRYEATTVSSLSDLLMFEMDEAPGAPLDDVVEVSNYVMALEHGLRRLRAGLPPCNRLIREMHARLLARGRGNDKDPGEFRRSQNWIGGRRPGTAHLSEEAVSTAQRLLSLCQRDQARIQGVRNRRAAGSALRVHQALQERPVISLQKLVDRTHLSFPAVSAGMRILEELDVAQELTGRKRNRLFGYGACLVILNEGTDPL